MSAREKVFEVYVICNLVLLIAVSLLLFFGTIKFEVDLAECNARKRSLKIAYFTQQKYLRSLLTELDKYEVHR